MRVLVANIPLPQNRFLVDLNVALATRAELVHSHEAFWAMEGAFDVVHLHFPEYLTYEIEEAYERGLSDTLTSALEERLRFWAEHSRIVITRHVLLPHDALQDPRWERLYGLVYRYCDGVAHFAQASIDEFRQRYRETAWYRGREPEHAMVPHHNYASLPNVIAREEARNRLGIPSDAKVMLIFGAIRNEAEKRLILQTFHNLRLTGKLLLVSRWRESLRAIAWIRLKYWVRDLTRLYYRVHPRYRFNYGFVEEEDTQVYLNSADVLFIPRLWVLNSGNVTLGMTYGKVVVGPDAWDIGELLRETGNPVFNPDRPETAASAVEEGFRLAAEGKRGPANRKLALKEWSADQCAALYVDLYRRVLEGRN
jgi:glycosyltransferase involved in cell wall biosynthesis